MSGTDRTDYAELIERLCKKAHMMGLSGIDEVEAAAAIAALQEAVDWERWCANSYQKTANQMAERVAVAEMERDNLRAALAEAVALVRPFAKRAAEVDMVAAVRKHARAVAPPVSFKHLRRARAFLDKHGGGG